MSKVPPRRFLKGFSGGWNVEKVIREVETTTNGSFYLCNLSDVIKKYDDWLEKIPRVKPFYAVKCNDNLEVLKALASIGCSFDCASAGEIAKIFSLGVEPGRVIFANTTKISSHIKYARENHVNLMTFDNEDEIYKIAALHSKTDLVLRIRCSSEKAKYKLGKKFGCDPVTEAPELLKLAKSLALSVVGISFHIGSSCEDFDGYCDAIEVSRRVYEVAVNMGFKIKILDIGGGFPGDNYLRIDEFSGVINKSLDENFPLKDFPDLEIYSEPGRYFVESAFTLVAEIHSRKITKDSDGEIQDVMYYLNEGVYSNFLFLPLGPEFVEPRIMEENRSSRKFKTILWGPTCDSTDVICRDIQLELLNLNDKVYFTNMGAYTITLRSPFNGFETTKISHFVDFNDCSRLDFSLFDLSSSTNGNISEYSVQMNPNTLIS